MVGVFMYLFTLSPIKLKFKDTKACVSSTPPTPMASASAPVMFKFLSCSCCFCSYGSLGGPPPSSQINYT